jgi:ech hydrogenase subunit A
MNLLIFLILFPLLPALISFLLPNGLLRDVLVRVGAAVIGVASIILAVRYIGGDPVKFVVPHAHSIDLVVFASGLVISAFLLFRCRKITIREAYIPILIIVQQGIVGWVETSGRMPEVEHGFVVDNLAIIMALIIGLVGGLIAIYSVTYMHGYQAHETHVKDRRRGFFFTFFLFLGGMFGIIFANNLGWMFLCWEITTLCSFLLIGYPGTEQATRNAYRALGLNLVGGLGFALALLYLSLAEGAGHTFALDELVELGPAVAMVPALLISFAGLAKSAQMPFSSWLLGAMVAPTPVSALLHSSTMVKAGVFIIIKFAPVFESTLGGYLVALVGAVTFISTSMLAVTQSDAKRVLAYSTIANLGLIIMCAGVGTPATIWAAILLTIFHAVAKALLFLGTGSIQHQIWSRDIEDMDGLIVRLPSLTVMMLIGILGMFLAPFGMLISKYAALRGLLMADGLPEGGIILALILAFGSAPTVYFWANWMGKLVGTPRSDIEKMDRLPLDESAALFVLTVFTFCACIFFLPLGRLVIDPYIISLYGSYSPTFEADTVFSMIFMMVMLFIMPLLYLIVPRKRRIVSGYLAGANIDGSASFRGMMGAPVKVESRNYYLRDFFNESGITRMASLISILLLGILVFVH